MSRLLFLLAVVVAVYLLLRSFRRLTSKQDASASTEEMVCCAQCGLHLPKSESVSEGNNYYCSDVHRREHSTG